MAASPISVKLGATKLYRTARLAVILAGLALMLAQFSPAQSAAGKKAIKGPRALGLVELAANGRARLVPITILYDGEYYDACAYKASPVPRALETGTLYEGFPTGPSRDCLRLPAPCKATIPGGVPEPGSRPALSQLRKMRRPRKGLSCRSPRPKHLKVRRY